MYDKLFPPEMEHAYLILVRSAHAAEEELASVVPSILVRSHHFPVRNFCCLNDRIEHVFGYFTFASNSVCCYRIACNDTLSHRLAYCAESVSF